MSESASMHVHAMVHLQRPVDEFQELFLSFHCGFQGQNSVSVRGQVLVPTGPSHQAPISCFVVIVLR